MLTGLFLQLLMGLLTIRFAEGRHALECFAEKVAALLLCANKGSTFVFGELLVIDKSVFAFSVSRSPPQQSTVIVKRMETHGHYFRVRVPVTPLFHPSLTFLGSNVFKISIIFKVHAKNVHYWDVSRPRDTYDPASSMITFGSNFHTVHCI